MFGNNLTSTEIRDEQITDMLKVFDKDGDQIITKEEFVNGVTEYFNQTKHALHKQYLPKENMSRMYQVFIVTHNVAWLLYIMNHIFLEQSATIWNNAGFQSFAK